MLLPVLLQVRSLVKTLVSSAYELCSQKEIDDAIESVRNVLGLQPAPRSEGENATASSATKSNGETQSGKSTNEGNGSSVFGPFSTGKPTRTGSLLSTKGMSFSFGSTKSSLRRMGSSDNSAASRSGFDLDQADFTFQQGAASSRTAGDLAFYKVLATLLRNTPTALVIENAQNCDELSWQELLIILMGFDLEMAVLVTIRNNFLLNTSDSNIDGAPATAEKAAAGGVDSKEGNGPDSPLRMPVGSFRSVPKLSRVSSQVDDFNASFIVSMPPETSARGINFEDGRFEASEAYQAICSHSNCTVKTMTGLKEDGVRHYLVHTLKVENISKDLVKTVYRISGGNFDWNRSVVMFIKERGVETFEEAIKDEATNESALRALIIYRISDLTPTARMVLRYASIVGHEFSERLLSSIVPHGTPRNSSSAAQQSEMRVPNSRRASVNASGAGRSEKSSTRGSSFSGARADRLRKARTVSGKIIVSSLGRSFKGRSGDGSSPMSAPQIISPALDTLTKLGFFNCIRESPVPLYEFQNEFVHATVYEMIPPRCASSASLS